MPFGFDDEEDKKNELETPAQSSVADEYGRIAADTSVEDASRSRSRNAILTASLMQGLDAILNKGNRSSDASYQQMRTNALGGVADAQKQKQQKLTDLLTQAKAKRQATEDAQSDKKFGWESEENDPNSPKAIAARPILAKKGGVDPAALQGLSFADQLKLVQAVKKSDPTGRPEGSQLKAAETDNGDSPRGVVGLTRSTGRGPTARATSGRSNSRNTP